MTDSSLVGARARHRRIAIALVHHPVLDKQRAIVTTAITNLDVHDLSRSARTYGVSDYFIVHPITAQRELLQRICEHWRDGAGGKRIPDRKLALELVRAVTTLEEAFLALGGRENVEVWVTAARKLRPPVTLTEARARLETEGKPVLVVFGTGWGLADSVIDGADALLEPVRAREDTGYNHLSVRAACAITLDRLLGF
jgi:hypothetical protein